MNAQAQDIPTTEPAAELVTLSKAKEWAQANIAEALTYVTVVQGFQILSAEDATEAGAQLVAITAFCKANETKRKSITDPYKKIADSIKGEFDKAGDKATEAATALRKALTEWVGKEERRVAAEKADAEKKLADERAQALADAAKLETKIDTFKTPEAQNKAAEKLNQVTARIDELSTTAVVAPKAQKIEGFSVRKNWQPEYGDINVLIRAAAENPKLARYLTWDTAAINKQVKASEADTDIPGVRAVDNRTSAVR